MTSFQGMEIHAILEFLAYFIAARIYYILVKNQKNNIQPIDKWILISLAIFGAFLGSKILHILEHLPYLLEQNKTELWLGGKSILGGFLGGTLGVEIGKKIIKCDYSTGDTWVLPLTVGLVIGRLGCQFSGPWDQTYGISTNLPWAWDYGDHVGRHPVALYEIILVLFSYSITRLNFFRSRAGASFAFFMLFYCIVRFVLEYLKPPFGDSIAGTMPVSLYILLYFNFTAIQWIALIGGAWMLLLFKKRIKHKSLNNHA